MNRAVMPIIFLVVVGLTSSCVIAPIPLVESSRKSMWDGVDGDRKKVSIVEEQRTWYLPIIASPEGPAKMRRQKSECRYFFGEDIPSDERRAWQHLGDLPWLTIEEDPNFY